MSKEKRRQEHTNKLDRYFEERYGYVMKKEYKEEEYEEKEYKEDALDAINRLKKITKEFEKISNTQNTKVSNESIEEIANKLKNTLKRYDNIYMDESFTETEYDSLAKFKREQDTKGIFPRNVDIIHDEISDIDDVHKFVRQQFHLTPNALSPAETQFILDPNKELMLLDLDCKLDGELEAFCNVIGLAIHPDHWDNENNKLMPRFLPICLYDRASHYLSNKSLFETKTGRMMGEHIYSYLVALTTLGIEIMLPDKKEYFQRIANAPKRTTLYDCLNSFDPMQKSEFMKMDFFLGEAINWPISNLPKYMTYGLDEEEDYSLDIVYHLGEPIARFEEAAYAAARYETNKRELIDSHRENEHDPILRLLYFIRVCQTAKSYQKGLISKALFADYMLNNAWEGSSIAHFIPERSYDEMKLFNEYKPISYDDVLEVVNSMEEIPVKITNYNDLTAKDYSIISLISEMTCDAFWRLDERTREQRLAIPKIAKRQSKSALKGGYKKQGNSIVYDPTRAVEDSFLD